MTTFQLTEESFKEIQDHIKQTGAIQIGAQERITKLESLKNIVYPNEKEFREALEKKVCITDDVYKAEIMPYVFTTYFSAMKFIVMAFFNLIIIGGIVILLAYISPSLFPLCARIEVKMPVLAITVLLFCHLCWRFLRREIIAFGEIITVKWFITISISKLTLLLDALHFWWLSNRILFSLTVLLFFMSGIVYINPPFFIRPNEAIPCIQHFFIKCPYTSTQTIPIEPDTMLTVTANERIWVSPTEEEKDAYCAWYSNRGGLDYNGKNCSVLYTAPLQKGNDTLTLRMQSPCKTREAYASIHIQIVTP